MSSLREGYGRRPDGPFKLGPSALHELGGEAEIRELVRRNLRNLRLTTEKPKPGLNFTITANTTSVS